MSPQIEQTKVGDLKAHPSNPRKITVSALETLKRSLMRDPDFLKVRPIIVNKRTGYVIAGNQRLRAAKELGWEDVPVITVDLDEETEKRWTLKDNKSLGEWEWELLKEYDTELLRDVGFLDAEIAQALGKEETRDDEFDLEEALSSIKEPKSQVGDIYELGRHRLICGDSTDPKVYRALLENERAQMVFTDPPYNIDYKGAAKNRREGIKNDKMSADMFYEFLHKANKAMIEHVDGAFYICMSPKELTTLKKSFEDAGGHFQSFIIWAKNTFTLGGADWQNQYEPILYGWPAPLKHHYFIGWRDEGNVWDNLDEWGAEMKGGKTIIKLGEHHLELDGEVTGKIISKKNQTDIWREKKPAKSKEHPTMKPLKLVAKAINASSYVDGIVLDAFGGSGSTLIACEQLNRKCRMIELDPKYVDVIVERWQNLTKQVAIKL